MKRTLNDIIIQILHVSPELINDPPHLHKKVEEVAGHKINFLHFKKRWQENFLK